MSIPLDRLYHYLGDLSNDAIVIYRWFPNGSKKLDDLVAAKSYYDHADRFQRLTEIGMICHDQEPLYYDYYTFDELVDTAQAFLDTQKILYPHLPTHTDDFAQILAKGHLRIKIDLPMNIHDSVLLCHSEKNSKQLELYENNGFIGVYYWSHALISRDWFRYAKHDKQLVPNFDTIKNDFLIYNRAWSGSREYRLKFVELLIEQDLAKHSNVKFNPWDNGTHYMDYKFNNTALAPVKTDFEQIIPLNTHQSHASADYCSDDYQASAIEVVLETLFDDSRQHITEKSLRPIACGRPFIIVGTPGSLSYLRDYGFKTFGGLIDESYDSIQDPVARLTAVTTELARIANLPRAEKVDLWTQLYGIAEHNKNRFFSDDFHHQVVSEFTDNLAQGIEKYRKTATGHWWNLFRDPRWIAQGELSNSEIVQRITALLKTVN